jgi:hypothetical protein
MRMPGEEPQRRHFRLLVVDLDSISTQMYRAVHGRATVLQII